MKKLVGSMLVIIAAFSFLNGCGNTEKSEQFRSDTQIAMAKIETNPSGEWEITDAQKTSEKQVVVIEREQMTLSGKLYFKISTKSGNVLGYQLKGFAVHQPPKNQMGLAIAWIREVTKDAAHPEGLDLEYNRVLKVENGVIYLGGDSPNESTTLFTMKKLN